MFRRPALLALILALFIQASIAGSDSKKATAVRTPTPPRMDGLVNDDVWKLAVPITDFVQHDPLEGEAPTQRTEVRILYDNEALYIGWKLYDPEPQKIVARLARRDDQVESDFVSVRLDSYHDHQTAFEFTVNAAGVRTDILQYNDGMDEDESWDVVWQAETAITPDGWSAELKIPFKVLRFSEDKVQEWGMQLIRYISRKHETQYWAFIRKSESGWVSKFGNLEGLHDLTRPGHVELLPYVAGGNRFVPKSPAFPNGRDLTGNIGLDAKIKPSSGLTIDATFNPDFGQVEADPAVLNLTTFETFYPEKRPFFIEGSQILRFTTFGGMFGPGLFYSRRIGHAINIAPPPRGYVENAPRFATILGAAKVSGKTADGFSIGVLEAVTAEEHATFVDSLGNKSKRIVEPLTNYSLVRLRKDVLGNSNAGMILTSVNRKGRVPGITAGIDWNLKFLESMYRAEGFLAGSHTTLFDGTLRDGTAGKFSLNKDGGPHWRGTFSFDYTSRSYYINDMGFFRSPNDFGWVFQVIYRDDHVTEYSRFWNVWIQYHLRRDFNWLSRFNSVSVQGNWTLPNYWELQAQGSWDHGRFDPFETRGNGLFAKSPTQTYSASVASDERQTITAQVSAQVSSDQRRMKSSQVTADLGIKAASNISIDFSLAYGKVSRQLAWVSNIPDPFGTGIVSIVADRSTSQWDLTSRGSLVFARDLTLQLYLQLFVAQGKYEDTRRMTAPDVFVPYSYPAPDFDRLVLNSNLVLRWEYLPGSTLYLVWSHARAGSGGPYSASFGDEVNNLLSLPMTNVILLKASYWLSY